MLEAEQIRNRLRTFLGDDRYEKFVTRVPSKVEGRRLLFWQERAWDEFVGANPDCSLSLAEIVSVFGDCPRFGSRIRIAREHALVKTWLLGGPLQIEAVDAKCGTQHPIWSEMKREVQDDDIIQEFRSPPETWARMAGRQGFALVRNGEVIQTVVTALN